MQCIPCNLCYAHLLPRCGLRGGYCELTNFDPGVQAQLYKCLSARLCSSLLGQVICIVAPFTLGTYGFQVISHLMFSGESHRTRTLASRIVFLFVRGLQSTRDPFRICCIAINHTQNEYPIGPV